MVHYPINEEDENELMELSIYIFDKNPDHFRKDERFATVFSGTSKIRSIFKFSAVLGYVGRSLYPVLEKKKVPSHRFMEFLSHFDRLQMQFPRDEKVAINQKRASSLIEKIKKKSIELDRTNESRPEAKGLPQSDIRSEGGLTINAFIGSKWDFYEVFEDQVLASTIRFGNIIDSEKIETFIEPGVRDVFHWRGEGFIDEASNYLVVRTAKPMKDISFGPLSMFIKIERSRTIFETAIGQITSNDWHTQLLTNRPILISSKKENQKINQKFLITTGSDSRIDPLIESYFNHCKIKNHNIPSAPVIRDRKTLIEWLKKSTQNLFNSISGTYIVSSTNIDFVGLKDLVTLSVLPHENDLLIILEDKENSIRLHGNISPDLFFTSKCFKGNIGYMQRDLQIFIDLKQTGFNGLLSGMFLAKNYTDDEDSKPDWHENVFFAFKNRTEIQRGIFYK